MIKTARQLKDKIRNISTGDNNRAALQIRSYGMERFLERVTISRYKNHFILKSGMLVASMVGLENRATMDIDTTLRNMPLNVETAKEIVTEILSVPVDDNIRFEMKEVETIMDEAEYGGIRLALDGLLDTMRIPLKIDISTGDVITPAEVTYRYRLMFEDRYITLWAYTLETVLAEKLETVLSRATANTRLRDFYDLYILQDVGMEIDTNTLAAAMYATSRKRESEELMPRYEAILENVHASSAMQKLWMNYQKKNNYAAGIGWDEVIGSIRALCDSCMK